MNKTQNIIMNEKALLSYIIKEFYMVRCLSIPMNNSRNPELWRKQVSGARQLSCVSEQ